MFQDGCALVKFFQVEKKKLKMGKKNKTENYSLPIFLAPE